MNTFPKILIISAEPFNKSNGTGITLSNLFDGWDKNSIAQVYLTDLDRDASVCDNFFQLNSKVAYVDHYFRSFVSSFFKKINIEQSNSLTSVPFKTKRPNLKEKLHLNARALADVSPVHLPDELFDWIKEFEPDFIYSPLGNVRILDITLRISKNINKPIVPHFMDDWPSSLYSQNELLGLARFRFVKLFNKMLERSNGGLCISQKMADVYFERYDLPFTPFVNCIDDRDFSSPSIDDGVENFTVMYIGGLHLNRWKSLLDVSSAVENIKVPIELHVYCPDVDAGLFSKYFIENKRTAFKGSIKSSEVVETLKKASLLLHIESFEASVALYTELSLSTKIPQYMAAGKPIFGYGPRGLASMLHIERALAGQIVNDEHSTTLFEKLEELTSNKSELYKYAVNGYEYAKQYHRKSINQVNLINTFEKLKNNFDRQHSQFMHSKDDN